jgi:periplasmic protein CpxP/Spy
MNKLVAATLASALLAGASLASAQAPAPGATPPSASGPRGDRPAFMRPTERIEARLAYVKTALKITPAQEPQWNAYANFLRKSAQDMEKRVDARRASAPAAGPQGPQGPRGPRPNAMERLERQQQFMADASKRLNDLIAVQRPLYESLSAEQRQTADVVLNQRVGPMQAGGRMRHMGPPRFTPPA